MTGSSIINLKEIVEMEIEKALKLREAHRKIALKVAAEVPEQIANWRELPPKHLEMTRIQLFETLTAIRRFDEVIESYVCDTDGDLLKEIEETKKTNGQFHRALLLLDEALSRKPAPVAEGWQRDNTVRPKLRKLSLKRFGGDPKDWMEFWDSFEGTIDKNDTLSQRDKFEYLKDCLEGKAKQVVAGFRLTEANYAVAVQMLKDRFGREEEIGRAHYEGMIKLQPVFSDRDIVRIRKLYDEVEFHHRSLQALEKSQDKYSDVFVPIVESKLPEGLRLSVLNEKREQWKMDELLATLAKEITIREKSKPNFEVKKDKDVRKEIPRKLAQGTTSSLNVVNERNVCVYCYEGHPSELCGKVTDVSKRKELLRKFGRCYICLRRNHIASQCRSKTCCTVCKERHHVSICNKEKQEAVNDIGPGLHVKDGRNIAMQTAQAFIRIGGSKKRVRCRVLFDSGSQRSFLSSSVVSMCEDVEKKEKEWLMVSGFGEREAKEMYCYVHNLEVESIKGGERVKLEATEVPLISRGLKNKHIERVQADYAHLRGLWFSDVSEREVLEVHLLIGSDYLWSFQMNNIVRGKSEEPVAIETKLGYVLSGPMKGVAKEELLANLCINEREEIKDSLNKLWDLETVGIKEVDPVHEDLIDNISFNGMRYSVGLPWKEGIGNPDRNEQNAVNRLKSLTKKLQKDPAVMKEYHNIFKEQEQEGIIERITKDQTDDNKERVHFLPHQAVIRKQAETTKVRIVFDASSKERKTGLSLNDTLHTGPSLTPLLFDVLLRLRIHKVVLIGDIKSAFLSIEVDERDRNALRFFWLDCLEDKDVKNPVIFRSCRVIFGAGPSPFILSGVLQHHIKQYAEQDPVFADKLLKGFYVDDLVTGMQSIEEAFALYEKTMTRMKEGGFWMRKWKSNKKELIERIEKDQVDYSQCKTTDSKEKGSENEGESNSFVPEKALSDGEKVLGVNWNTVKDKFWFNLKDIAIKDQANNALTKRSILKVLASLYDPLGILSPIMAEAKILFQDICKDNINWDEELNETYKQRWHQWLKELEEASIIEVERCVLGQAGEELKECHLHGFCDASEKAYCCMIFLHIVTEKEEKVTLLTSKTRVTPLKSMSIPRLELTAARILAQMKDTVTRALEKEIEFSSINLWTDSMTTLWWIMNRREWKQYVKNRVNEILLKTEMKDWRYCPGKQNPADLGSRGMKATELKESKIWWSGPAWISDRQNWPETNEVIQTENAYNEQKINSIAMLSNNE